MGAWDCYPSCGDFMIGLLMKHYMYGELAFIVTLK